MSLFSNFPQSPDAEIKEEIAALKNRVQPVEKGGTGATTAAQALANLGGIEAGAVGNLHVWKRVQTYSEEVPAGYTLGEKESTKICEGGYYSNGRIIAYTGTEISVDKGGNVTLGGTTDTVDDSLYGFVGQTNLRGKYVRFKPHITGSSPESQVFVSGVFYVPNDANCTFLDGSTSKATSSTYGLIIDKLQAVKAYPAIPAGTTTDYLTSTDRNAYPDKSAEGGQDAYYTLGDVVIGSFVSGGQKDETYGTWSYGSELSVSSDGALSLSGTTGTVSTGYGSGSISSVITELSVLKGKFAQLTTNRSGLTIPTGVILFIPTDMTITNELYGDGVNNKVIFNKYQPVTGHAAIPANTTITYLGQLGGGARIEVGSYVGTGTYGSSNPNSLTFDFVPKVVMLLFTSAPVYGQNYAPTIYSLFQGSAYNPVMVTSMLTNSPQPNVGFMYNSNGGTNTYNYAWISSDKRTIYWYNTQGSTQQFNGLAYQTIPNTYHYVAIG